MNKHQFWSETLDVSPSFQALLLLYSPVALFRIFRSCTVTLISVDDGLLRTSTGCAGPSFSLTLYVDWWKETMMVVSFASVVTKNYKEIVIIGFTTEMYTSVSVIKSFNLYTFYGFWYTCCRVRRHATSQWELAMNFDLCLLVLLLCLLCLDIQHSGAKPGNLCLPTVQTSLIRSWQLWLDERANKSNWGRRLY